MKNLLKISIAKLINKSVILSTENGRMTIWCNKRKRIVTIERGGCVILL